MRVQEVITSDNRKRYVLLGDDSLPIVPVVRYLKYLDMAGRARNTIASYAYNLRLYYEYLQQSGLDYSEITIDDLAGFVFWLKNPYRSVDLVPSRPVEQARTNRTINVIMTTVSSFYDYLWRQEDLAVNLNAKMQTYLPARTRSFKGFLHHVAKGRLVSRNLLKQKVPHSRPRTLPKESVNALVNACSNERDQLLLMLLYETSMRIGEALALWLEDVDVPRRKLCIRDRGPLANGAEIKSASSCRDIDVTADLINSIMQYVERTHRSPVETNHLFLILRGPCTGSPLTYPAVCSLFRRLKRITGVDATAHLLRHTSLTELARAGWKPEHLRIRAGHAHFQTTFQMYVHPSDEDIRGDWEQTMRRLQAKKDVKEDGNE